jgi:hypothetical protein
MNLDTMTRPEAAQALGVSVTRVGQLVNTGQLQGELVGKRWQVSRSSVLERLRTSELPPGAGRALYQARLLLALATAHERRPASFFDGVTRDYAAQLFAKQEALALRDDLRDAAQGVINTVAALRGIPGHDPEVLERPVRGMWAVLAEVQHYARLTPAGQNATWPRELERTTQGDLWGGEA